MSTSRTLYLDFNCDSGDTRSISIANASESLTADTAKTVGQTFVENNIFEDALVEFTKAEVVDRETTVLYDIDDETDEAS